MNFYPQSDRPKMTGSRMFALFLVAFFIILSGYLYFSLGGFSSPEITRTHAPEYVLYGTPFQGKVRSREYAELYLSFVEAVESDSIPGVLASICYNIPEQENDSIDTFIGVMLSAGQTPPEGLERRVVPARPVLQAAIDAHQAIAPVRVYPVLEKYAKDNGIEISLKEALEIYPRGAPEVIQVPVIE